MKKMEYQSLNPFEFGGIQRKNYDYKGYEKKSEHLMMRDGVRIAIEVILPKNLSPNSKISTILMQTRYWRDYKFRIPFKWFIQDMAETRTLYEIGMKRGYGFIRVDVRGTGASFGSRPYPWHEKEVNDGREIIDWVIKQPWSDGSVVTMGGSYLGVTAEYVTTLGHPALKASSPFSNQWDCYTEVAYPGGLYNHFFIRIWGLLGRALDFNNSRKFLSIMPLVYLFVSGVKPLETDKKNKLLKKAIKDHFDNTYVFENEDVVMYRNDPLVKQVDDTADDVSVCMKKEKIIKSKTPLFCLGGWYDGATCDNIINRFMTYTNPMRAVIGDWDHGLNRRANPYFYRQYDVIPDKEVQLEGWMDFFDKCRLEKEGFSERSLYYYTMGEEKWKKTETWPPNGQTMHRWYFNENHSLKKTPPELKLGEDKYKVDFEVTSGKGNRWHTHYAQKMYYAKREKVDEKLLVYDSAPLEKDMEITGHPIITLYLSSTHEDGAIIAYLEDIDEERKVYNITEGELRFIHRKISEEDPPYKIMVPYHSFKREDSQIMVPGEVTEIKFGFLPTSVLIKKGHKIRIAICGADKQTFSRYPSEGNPTIKILRNKNNSSYIDLPVILKNQN
jgi:putative CocE/NonD family hydrolase